MRVIDTYTFYFGTKIPLSEIPDRIHQFLDSMNLKSDRFMYFFEDCEPHNGPRTWATQGCKRILKDCPELGRIRIMNERDDDYPFITNLDGDTFPEEKLLPLMTKIHKRYGFYDTFLFYSDINFFGEVIPFKKPDPINGSYTDDDFTEFYSYWNLNTGIVIHRWNLTQDNYISLRVDALFGGELRDTSHYYKALRAVLPQMRSYHESYLLPTKEEKAIIDSNNLKAVPVLEKCVQFFKDRLPIIQADSDSTESLGASKIMKQIAKEYGFTYSRAGNGDYKAAKKTARNAVIYVELEISSQPYSRFDLQWDGVSIVVSFQGVGFKHELFCDLDIPRNRKAIVDRLNEVFYVIKEFEKTHLEELDACFEETPAWFVPSAYFDKEFGGYQYK